MKKRRKWMSILAGMMLAVTMMTGCGSSDSGEQKEIVTENETADAEEKAPSTDVTIEEQVLLDQNGIVITAQEYVTDSVWGDGIKLLIENNSDVDIQLSCEATIVNDYMINDLFVSEVAAGKKANEVLYLYSQELEAAGIETIGKIELYFMGADSTTYDTIFHADCVTIETSAINDMDTTADDSGNELYNEGGIRIVGKAVDENSFWGTAILLYVENTSGRNVCVSVEDMSINGFMIDPFFATTIYDGKKDFDSITIFDEDLESNGIESIEDVELQFNIFDVNTYDTVANTSPIQFSVK